MLDTESLRRPFDVTKIGEDVDRELAKLVKDSPRHSLLTTRQQTHGSFEDNAEISQGLKTWFRSTPGWDKLTSMEKEAMDMIALKFSRILSGKPMLKEHWEDVVGYAKLIEEKCV